MLDELSCGEGVVRFAIEYREAARMAAVGGVLDGKRVVGACRDPLGSRSGASGPVLRGGRAWAFAGIAVAFVWMFRAAE